MSDFILMTQLARQHREMMDVQLGANHNLAVLAREHGATVANYNNLLRDYKTLQQHAKERIAELERQLAEADLARQRAEAETASVRSFMAMKQELAERSTKKDPFAS